MDKPYYLGKLNINWADEMDLVYYDIYDDDAKAALEKLLEDRESVTLYFGTNEEGEFSGRELLDAIEWTLIPDDDTKRFLECYVCDNDNSMDNVLETIYDDNDDYDYDNVDEQEDD